MFHCRDSSITSLQVGMFTELLRLCCVHTSMPLMVESNSVTMLCRFLNATSPFDHKYGTVRKTFAETALVKVECGYGRAADSHLCRVSSVPAFRCTCLVLFGIPFGNAPLSGLGGAGLDEQLDLALTAVVNPLFLSVLVWLLPVAACVLDFCDDILVSLTLAVGRS